MQDVGAQPADLQSLIAVMNPAKLATSLQHMALQYRDLQDAATGTWETAEDNAPPRTRGQWPAPLGSLSGHASQPTRDNEEEFSFSALGEYAYQHPTTHDDMPHLPWHTVTADDEEGMANGDDQPRTHKATRSAPLATKRSIPQQAGTRGDNEAAELPFKEGTSRQQRMPAAKLETFAGQGASVESFLAKFESHAAYVSWSEKDRLFQLKNSLTGTAAQALWTGGEHATSAGLITILHSQHGSKLQTARFWAELRARKRRKDEPSRSSAKIYAA